MENSIISSKKNLKANQVSNIIKSNSNALESKTEIKCSIYYYNGVSVIVDTIPDINSSHIWDTFEESDSDDLNNLPKLNIVDFQAIIQNKSIEDIQSMISDKLEGLIENPQSSPFEQYEESKESTIKTEDKIESTYDPFEIVNRDKYEKLTHEQINFLKQQLIKNENRIMMISRIYRVSPSTLSRIKNKSFEIIHNLPRRNIVKMNDKVKFEVKEAIEKFYWDQKFPFTVKDVQSYLLKRNKISISYNSVNKIMKNNWNLSFKKVLSRPIIADMNKVRLMRKLFSIKIRSELNPQTLIINWDEWSINRNTKSNYSWSLVGINKEFKNSALTGSISLIMSIFSNEVWFVMLSNSTTNSEIFTHYLIKMNDWINKNNMFGYSKAFILLDNWPYHKSKRTLDKLKRIKMNLMFLPPYSPSLAPIELIFGLIKQKLCKQSIGVKLNLNTKEASKKILDVIKSLSKQCVIKTFAKFYEEIKINLSLK